MNVFTELLLSFVPSTDGALYMWVILMLCFLFLYLCWTQWKLYRELGDVHPERFLLRMRVLVSESRFDEALAICNSAGKRALPQIVKVALENRTQDADVLISHIEEKVVHLAAKVERRIHYFSTVGNVATLLGLMGTIYGLILAFAAVGKPGVSAAVKTSMLASGISAAMNTTLLGLILAVPCMMMYSYFQTQSIRFIDLFDRQSASILNLLFTEDTKLKNYKPSQRRIKKKTEDDLDITPIMGLMVTLIPLLLSSAEFVKIGAIEMNLPRAGRGGGSGMQAEQEKPRKLNLGLLVTKKGIYISHDLDGTKNETTDNTEGLGKPDIPAKDSSYDLKLLSRKLWEIKKRSTSALILNYSGEDMSASSLYQMMRKVEKIDLSQAKHYKDFETVKLIAEEKIPFQKIIDVMDASRNVLEKGQRVPLFPEVSMGAGVKSAF